MLIIYYRLYITSTLTRVLFNLNQSNELKDTHKLEPLTKETLPPPQKLHHKAKRLQNIEEIEALFPEFKAFIDATEQEIPKPKNKQKRKTHYSGKRKKHTVKTQLTVNFRGLIIHKSRHVKGSTHNYTLYKHRYPKLPSKVVSGLDLGYLGIKDDYPNLNCVLPIKKKNPGRGKVGVKAPELSVEQKALNRDLASELVWLSIRIVG
jgi:hypothetical protein